MKIQTTFLLMAAAVICLSYHGLCIAGQKISRCRCVKVSSQFIHPSKFQHIDIFPPGPHCRRVEIVITLKKGIKVCVNPEATWVKKVINILTERNKNNEDSLPSTAAKPLTE
ncbi:interleukin-8-like [Pristis pectinata]|uniref:interleukin-8-like n=1 Tax=Pristis pectinata TaxID=685728 RepID=UPI00223CBC8B|nr:interleukin-8-like [Pristis pectinata]